MTTPPPAGPTDADFDAWNTQKKRIHTARQYPHFYKEAEVWWCFLGVNIDHEQNGDSLSYNGKPPTYQRPVLVLRKLDAESCIILPLTTQPHTGSRHFEMSTLLRPKARKNWVCLTQVRLVSASRLYRRIAELPEPEYQSIKRAFRRIMRL